mgnify:CR=1 FL=1
MNYKADIGVFGGSGFYSFLENVEEIEIETPYGKTSDKISLAQIGDKKVAFLPRHAKDHSFPPHLIPFQANLYAMKMLGVKYIIAPTASGSLRVDYKPGDFVICDQFVDRTCGRKDTFFTGPEVRHISPAEPYNEKLRQLAIQVCEDFDIPVHKSGTVVVIQGPRFSTKAESRWFSNMGWDVINMTQYPECMLAKELDIPYANIALITDYDAGLEGNPEVKPVTEEEVYRVFKDNNEKVKKVLYKMIEKLSL